MKKSTVLSFKYTTSKGRDTYGYNIVSLYANGERVARTCGGGYDMRGTCLGQYIKANYIERLKALTGNHGSMDDGTGFYGLMFTVKDGETYKRVKNYEEGAIVSLDGACGIDCMVRIADAVGVKLESVKIAPNEWGYILTDTYLQNPSGMCACGCHDIITRPEGCEDCKHNHERHA